MRLFEPIGVYDKGQQFFSSNVRDVMSDRLGRIWYATQGTGAIRYDGYNFQRYEYDWSDSTSISSNRITNVIEDQEGNIWMAGALGIDRLDIKTGKFKRFGQPAGCRAFFIQPLDEDLFLIGTNQGIWELDPRNGSFSAWHTANKPDAQPSVSSFYASIQGNIWASSSHGLMLINPKQKTYEIIEVKRKPETKAQGCQKVFQTQKGDIWVVSDDGLLQYMPLSKSFVPTTLPDSMQNYIFNDVEEGPDGSLWLSSLQGLVHWHPETNVVEHYWSRSKLQDIFPGTVASLCLDRLGNLWAGTSIGLRKTNIKAPNYRLYQIERGRDLLVNQISWSIKDKKGGTLMNSNTMVYYASGGLGQPAKKVNLPPEKQMMPFQTFVNADPKGEVYVSWWQGGLGHWDPERMQFKDVFPDTVFGKEIVETQCFDRFDEQILWVGTASGLCQVNRKTGAKKCFPTLNLLGKPTSALEILEAPDSGLWCELRNGPLTYFDRQDQKFFPIHPDSTAPDKIVRGEILDIAVDQKGALWVAFMGGLSKISWLGNGRFACKTLTQKDGLVNNSLTAVEVDSAGFVWVGYINDMMSKVDPNTFQIRNYDVLRSLLTRQFIRKAFYLNNNGYFYYGTRDGLVVFNPEKIELDSTPPKLVLARIFVNNKRLDIQAEFTKNLILNASENAISLEFVGIHLDNPYSNRYQYQLIGYDTSWVQSPSDLRRASYTNLAPGPYRFIVRASNASGVWSGDVELLSFVINPPYYQTTWFRFMMLIIGSGIIYAILYNRIQQRKLEAQKQLAEQNARYKSQFLANMSHEIRTPMNAILGLSRLLDEGELQEKEKEYVGAIRHSSEDLLRIINDILDYSKIESGFFTFQIKPFELRAVLHHINRTFAFKAKEKGLTFTINPQSDLPDQLIGDAVRLTQILTNLISNAIKFTEKGTVEVLISAVDRSEKEVRLKFEVRDTGIGIPEDKMQQVFESFNQVHAEDSTAKGGTGLGLSIAKQLVEQQGGSITLNSKPHHGTEVSFILVFQRQSAHEQLLASASEPDFSSLNDLSILLVEDVYFNQLLAKEILLSKIKGVQVEIAENGQVALNKLREKHFDLILMDIKMPVMNGLDATRAIRSWPETDPLHNIPIVGLTANAVPEELEKCQLAGMDAWVTKPIEPNELLEAMYQSLLKHNIQS